MNSKSTNNQNKPKCLILYNEVMGYTDALVKALTLSFDVWVICWDEERKLTPFNWDPPADVKVSFESQLGTAQALRKIFRFDPDLLIVNGWQSKRYLIFSLMRIWHGCPSVVTFDGQINSRKRWAYRLAKAFAVPSLFFTHALVAGPRQSAYALALGFSRSKIIEGFLSADVELFEKKHLGSSQTKKRRILYVGRLAPEKGLQDLLLAWDHISINDGWELRVIGGTEQEWSALLRDTFQDGVAPHRVRFSAFSDSDLIAREMLEAAVFVLPSKYEPWGVVLHEAALCGCFLIATDKVGAGDQLIQNDANGLICRSGYAALEASLRDVVSRELSLVVEAGKISVQLAQALNPKLTAEHLRQLV